MKSCLIDYWLPQEPFPEVLQHLTHFAKAVLLNEEGGAILQKAVPLVEEIDEVFFGKLKSDEAQFKHLLGRLHEE